jgi:hypothetical protein
MDIVAVLWKGKVSFEKALQKYKSTNFSCNLKLILVKSVRNFVIWTLHYPWSGNIMRKMKKKTKACYHFWFLSLHSAKSYSKWSETILELCTRTRTVVQPKAKSQNTSPSPHHHTVPIDVDEWEPGLQITSPCDAVSASEVKSRARGLNRRFSTHAAGGVGACSHPLPGHVIRK